MWKLPLVLALFAALGLLFRRLKRKKLEVANRQLDSEYTSGAPSRRPPVDPTKPDLDVLEFYFGFRALVLSMWAEDYARFTELMEKGLLSREEYDEFLDIVGTTKRRMDGKERGFFEAATSFGPEAVGKSLHRIHISRQYAGKPNRNLIWALVNRAVGRLQPRERKRLFSLQRRHHGYRKLRPREVEEMLELEDKALAELSPQESCQLQDLLAAPPGALVLKRKDGVPWVPPPRPREDREQGQT
jgi:hypothetical protein